jgi:hypothetical protein
VPTARVQSSYSTFRQRRQSGLRFNTWEILRPAVIRKRYAKRQGSFPTTAFLATGCNLSGNPPDMNLDNCKEPMVYL